MVNAQFKLRVLLVLAFFFVFFCFFLCVFFVLRFFWFMFVCLFTSWGSFQTNKTKTIRIVLQ